MKRTPGFLAVAMALLVVTQACKRSQTQALTQDRFGIGVDWPRLDSEFSDNDPAIRTAAATIKRSILYHQFPQALADLESLAANPALTDPQKKILTDLRDQTRQVMAKASPQTAQ